jgi:ubiquinone/menaquinone biosynthesis C-methylase UbiE
MNDFQTQVDCIKNGAPHEKEAREFLEFIGNLSTGPESFHLRTLATWELFQRTESLLDSDEFDVSNFADFLVDLKQRIEHAYKAQLEFSQKLDFSILTNNDADFRDATKDHYGNLFKKFTDIQYFDEAYQLLKTRLDRSGVSLGDLSSQRALDAGCGGGRYSFALKSLGFGEVSGIDFSQLNIDNALKRKESKGISDINFQIGNVLDLPFEDSSFDFVFSNGVLHHTESTIKGLKEIRRVLKLKGKAWLYVIEKPGGLHWDMVEILRNLMQPVSRDYARAFFALIGVPGNRIFYILDHIMVPINERTTIQEIEDLIYEAGFSNVYRLNRGADFDRIEHLYRKRPKQKDLIWKYGVGEHRYILTP